MDWKSSFNNMFDGIFQTPSSRIRKSVDNAADKDGGNLIDSDGDEFPGI